MREKGKYKSTSFICNSDNIPMRGLRVDPSAVKTLDNAATAAAL
jgi:hypothetical protein